MAARGRTQFAPTIKKAGVPVARRIQKIHTDPPPVKRKVVGRLDVPVDALRGLARMEIVGDGEMLIENHTGIIEYSPADVKVAAKRRIIHIKGEDLLLDGMDAENLHIKGKIKTIEFI